MMMMMILKLRTSCRFTYILRTWTSINTFLFACYYVSFLMPCQFDVTLTSVYDMIMASRIVQKSTESFYFLRL